MTQQKREWKTISFNGFKFNTYQEHLKRKKQMKDDNIDPFELEIIDTPYDEQSLQYADMAAKYIMTKVRENFEPITASIWRLRYMVTIDGQELNFKKIKQITKIDDVRRRIVMVNKWVRNNITKQDIETAIKNQEIFN